MHSKYDIITYLGQNKMAATIQTTFQMYFLEWKSFYFELIFTEVRSWGCMQLVDKSSLFQVTAGTKPMTELMVTQFTHLTSMW